MIRSGGGELLVEPIADFTIATTELYLVVRVIILNMKINIISKIFFLKK